MQALKADLAANGMFLHAEHMRELQKLSDKRRLQQMTSVFVEKSDPGRCCIQGCDIARYSISATTTRRRYDLTISTMLAAPTLSIKYVLKIDTTQHAVPDVICRHCCHNEGLNPGMFIGEETSIFSLFFLESIHFLPEGIDGSKPPALQMEALAAATAPAVKSKTLDIEDINAGIGAWFTGSNQIAHFRAQVLDARGTSVGIRHGVGFLR